MCSPGYAWPSLQKLSYKVLCKVLAANIDDLAEAAWRWGDFDTLEEARAAVTRARAEFRAAEKARESKFDICPNCGCRAWDGSLCLNCGEAL